MPTIESVTVGPADQQTAITVVNVAVAAVDNQAIYLAVHIEQFNDVVTNTPDHNGKSFALVDVVTGATWSRIELWELIDPDVATDTIAITVEGPGAEHARAVAIVVSDVHQVTPIRQILEDSGNSGTASTIDLTSSLSGDLLLDFLTIDSSGHSAVVGADQFTTYLDDWGTISAFDFAGSEQAADDGGSMSWTWTTSAPFSHLAIALAPPDAVMQKLRPDADIATTGWSTAPLWSKIEEESADGTVISAVAS